MKLPKIRDWDCHGSGAYLAPRGNRKHNGIDICCDKNEEITAFNSGTVTKIGYPYNPNHPKKGHLRYVQVTDDNGYNCRYFYVDPFVKVGDKVKAGDAIGTAQGLIEIYPGITDHYHFEVKSNAMFINPIEYIEGL